MRVVCRAALPIVLLLVSGAAPPSGRTERVPSALPPTPPEVYLDRSGVTELFVWEAIIGAVGGLTLGTLLLGDDTTWDQPMGGLGVAAGIGGTAWYTASAPVPSGPSVLAVNVQLLGLQVGSSFSYLLFESGDWHGRARPGVVLGALALGSVAGFAAASEVDATPGQAASLGSLTFLGTLVGLLLGNGFDLDAREKAGLTLSAQALGAFASAALWDELDIGRSRWVWATLGSIFAGGAFGIIAGKIIDANSGRSFAFTTSASVVVWFSVILAASESLDTHKRRRELSGLGLELVPPRLPESIGGEPGRGPWLPVAHPGTVWLPALGGRF
jgi:hypothetical protein